MAKRNFRTSAARGTVAAWILAAAACAPVIKDFRFAEGDPLHGKRIGVVYSRSGPEGSEGVDGKDLHEFLGALASTLGTHGRDARFVDLTESKDIGPFPRVALPDTGMLGRITQGYYAVPDSPGTERIPDSLDYLLLISGLSFTGGSPIEDTSGATHRSLAWLDAMNMGMDPLRPPGSAGALRVAPGVRVGVSLSGESDRGDATEGTEFRYLVWDRRAEGPLAYKRIRMRQAKSFGSETTTFAQDAERIGQTLLKELTK
jgi:hypothetical protein